MPLGDAYLDSTHAALSVMASRPLDPEAPAPKHSVWTTIPRAVSAAAVEIGGNILDTAGAFGQVAASAGGLTPGFDPDAKKRAAEGQKAYQDLKTQGIDWRTPESRVQYDFARDLRPDPLTAGAAENIVFGLSKGLTKAVGASVGLGAVGGAVTFGASEGLTTADDLAVQGVDQTTRTKVGAVVAAVNTAGMAIPVAGKTMTQTLGLGAVGGPGSFVTQQLATREILRAADYGAIAEQYDPLDPVGLTIATALPLGFGALAMRGARVKAKADATAVPDAAPDLNVIAPTQTEIDAAMVQNLTAARDRHDAMSQAPDEALRALGIDPEARPPVVEPAAPKPIEAEAAPATTAANDAGPDLVASRVEQLKTERPDMPVAVREDGAPAALADHLEQVKKLAQEGTDDQLGAIDAPLLQVAAECALSLGAAA